MKSPFPTRKEIEYLQLINMNNMCNLHGEWAGVACPDCTLNEALDKELDNKIIIDPDSVNSPSHYINEGMECIDAIKASLTPEEFAGFCKGNVLKYTWRERKKGGTESLKKAQWYMRELISERDSSSEKSTEG